ncbi:hypothetical protein D3C87_1916520 [compost metagenome]
MARIVDRCAEGRLGGVVYHDRQSRIGEDEAFQGQKMPRQDQCVEPQAGSSQRRQCCASRRRVDPVVLRQVLKHRPDTLQPRVSCKVGDTFGSIGGRQIDPADDAGNGGIFRG